MYSILIKGILLFLACQVIHIVIWRIKKPSGYMTWFPILFIIFVPLAALVAYGLVHFFNIWGDEVATPWLEWSAIMLFQSVLSLVYIIGYTAVAAFSPSMEIIKALNRAPAGLPRNQLATPFFEETALSDDRINNLIKAELIREEKGALYLARRGRSMTHLVLLYRHLIGLPDGGGG